MKLAEILSGPDTWCQRAYEDAGRVCLEGALIRLLEIEVQRPDGWLDAVEALHRSREVDRLWNIIGCPVDVLGHPTGIHEWNDAPWRTWEEVASVVEAYDRDRLLNP